MGAIFRKRVISIDSDEITLVAKDIKEIFKFGESAFLVIGSSNSGKTTLATDIIFTFAKECSNIYYMTATSDSIGSASFSNIPKAFRREPNIENLINIWTEIKNAFSTIRIDNTTLLNLISTAYGNATGSNIIIEINKKKEEIIEKQTKYYTEKGYNKQDIFNRANDDANAFVYNVVFSIIHDYITANGDGVFSTKDMSLIRSFYSTRPKTLLVLDDLTSQIDAMSKSNKKVKFEGKLLKEKEALNTVLLDILNTSRHFNCLVIIFLHTPDIFSDKSMFNHVIMMNSAAAEKIINAKTIPESTRKIIRFTKDYVFNDFPYYFLYVNSINCKNICVGKAEIRTNDKLDLDEQNSRYIAVYNQILSGVNAGTLAENMPANETTNENTPTETPQNDDGEGYEYYSDENMEEFG